MLRGAHVQFPSCLHPEWPSTRRRTSCPARTWASSSAQHWWGPPSWMPWRRSTTSDTRDSWWKRSLHMKTCCSERRRRRRRRNDSSTKSRKDREVGKVLIRFVLTWKGQEDEEERSREVNYLFMWGVEGTMKEIAKKELIKKKKNTHTHN